jgi:hypothetical protein
MPAFRTGRAHSRPALALPFVSALLAAACQDPVGPRAAAPTAPMAAAAAADAAPLAVQPWQLANPATNREIEGYASAPSVNTGENIQLFVNTASPTYSVDVYRMGWEGGAGGALVASDRRIRGVVQPAPVTDPVTGLIECRWRSPYQLKTRGWKSGVYLAKLTSSAGKDSYVLFVVRDDARRSAFLMQLSTNTYQAYNNWGGRSLYDFNSTGGGAVKVSFDRPYGLSAGSGGAAGLGAGEFLVNMQQQRNSVAGWEYNMVRFLERENYDVTYTTDYDVGVRPQSVLTHKALVVVGHDEYWTMGQRNAIVAARDAGVDLAFFAANSGLWQVRFEPAASGAQDRTMVAYKSRPGDPVTDRTLLTTKFRLLDPPLPENKIMGVLTGDAFFIDDDVVIDDASTWVTAGTGLVSGSRLPGLLGFEIDTQTEVLNPTHKRIAHSVPSAFFGAYQEGDMTVYEAPSGATVFATGTMQWTWGLDDWGAGPLRSSRLSTAAQQITRNVLNRMRQ